MKRGASRLIGRGEVRFRMVFDRLGSSDLSQEFGFRREHPARDARWRHAAVQFSVAEIAEPFCVWRSSYET